MAKTSMSMYNNDEFAEGNVSEYAKGNDSNEPLDDDDDNEYAEECNLAKGDGNDEPLAEEKDNDKYAKGNNNNEY